MLIPFGWLAASGGAAGSYELIATQILTGYPTSVTFSSIPQTYKHLQLRFTTKSDFGGDTAILTMRLNGNSGTNYNWHQVQAAGGGSITSTSGGPEAQIRLGEMPALYGSTGAINGGIIDIVDYTSTTNFKTIRAVNGMNASTGSNVGLRSGLFRNTAAVTSVSMQGLTSTVTLGSRFSLYGIKGA